jgi:hypothetical protein
MEPVKNILIYFLCQQLQKDKSKAINRSRTDNAMVNRKKHNILHSKLRLCNTNPQTRRCFWRMNDSCSTIGTRRVFLLTCQKQVVFDWSNTHSTGRQVTPLGSIILIPMQPVFVHSLILHA